MVEMSQSVITIFLTSAVPVRVVLILAFAAFPIEASTVCAVTR
jgi:hypothetical protein